MARMWGENMNSRGGKILSFLCDQLGVDSRDINNVSPKDVKRSIKYCSLDEEEMWKIGIAHELIYSRHNMHQTYEIPGFDLVEIQTMLDDICVN